MGFADGVQFAEAGVRRGESRRRGFEQLTDFQDVGRAGALHAGDGADQRVAVRRRQKGAPPDVADDHAVLRQEAHGAAHRVAGDAEFIRKVALGRHASVLHPLAGRNPFFECDRDIGRDEPRHPGPLASEPVMTH